jgi:predicted dehydrogenase
MIKPTAMPIAEFGRLGRITAISAQWMLLKSTDYFEIAHRREPGAGPVLINAVHDIDDLRFIVGEIDAVQAMTLNAVRSFAVEDTAVILLHIANGALGTLTVSDRPPRRGAGSSLREKTRFIRAMTRTAI